ncbi:hypothetical protein BJF78_17680 [Pseudonocardia sp. CNS-139]|nr:hypothetical protein BJF78_17680 [Pseudonocardia sp. CNS-139]
MQEEVDQGVGPDGGTADEGLVEQGAGDDVLDEVGVGAGGQVAALGRPPDDLPHRSPARLEQGLQRRAASGSRMRSATTAGTAAPTAARP